MLVTNPPYRIASHHTISYHIASIVSRALHRIASHPLPSPRIASYCRVVSQLKSALPNLANIHWMCMAHSIKSLVPAMVDALTVNGHHCGVVVTSALDVSLSVTDANKKRAVDPANAGWVTWPRLTAPSKTRHRSPSDAPLVNLATSPSTSQGPWLLNFSHFRVAPSRCTAHGG